MSENPITGKSSKIISGIKYVYLLAFFALVSGVFYPFITDSSTDSLVYGVLILFLGLAGGVLVYKGMTSPNKLTLTPIGLVIIIISLFLIFQLATTPLF